MKILYDHQIFTSQKYGGISRYFYELVRELDNISEVQYEIPLLVSNNHYISDKRFVNYINLLPNKQFRGKHRIFKLLNKPNNIWKLKQQKFDVFHPTYYDPYFLKYLGNKPFVLTVYDMIHEKFSDMFSSTDKTTEQKRLLVEKATKIIAISESTKKDLIELFGTDESKIEVVYLGNSMFPKADIKLGFEIPKKYLLFVGGRGAYKNFERFIKSVSELLNQDKELFVLCTGGGKFSSSESQLLNELEISKQVLQFNLDDDSLAYFYKNALAFIFPSLYEGFGIPVLESFACGCPLLCSNVSSLPEVAGDAACYFDPYSEESIKNAVSRVLNDSNFRKELINKGYEQLKEFSWKKTAEETKKIYESVLI
ncbi:glycosyltransferase family 4 protein [Aliarcobacter cryaerophilus]|uniref:glycosyltransferase family 4 protein n=1 Tax=Aliarcobacter cryaerophilus TaxID=28198 RepID=UPI003DA4D83F